MMNMGEIESAAMSELRRIFNPEFLNRVDEIVVFNPLDQEQINEIFDIEIAELSTRLGEQNYSIKIEGSAKNYLVEKGWDPKYGGRLLRRTIQKDLEVPLSERILEGHWAEGTLFTVDIDNGEIKINGINVLDRELALVNELE